MIPPELFRNLKFRSLVLVAGLYNFGFYGGLFCLSIYLHERLGLSPFDTGLALLPLNGAIGTIALAAGRLIGRLGEWPAVLIELGFGALRAARQPSAAPRWRRRSSSRFLRRHRPDHAGDDRAGDGGRAARADRPRLRGCRTRPGRPAARLASPCSGRCWRQAAASRSTCRWRWSASVTWPRWDGRWRDGVTLPTGERLLVLGARVDQAVIVRGRDRLAVGITRASYAAIDTRDD
jgi:hypothetical protein